jgi:hypothetical protein
MLSSMVASRDMGYRPGPGLQRTWYVSKTVLAEHWDVLQDEATRAESLSGLPMFGNTFPD